MFYRVRDTVDDDEIKDGTDIINQRNTQRKSGRTSSIHKKSRVKPISIELENKFALLRLGNISSDEYSSSDDDDNDNDNTDGELRVPTEVTPTPTVNVVPTPTVNVAKLSTTDSEMPQQANIAIVPSHVDPALLQAKINFLGTSNEELQVDSQRRKSAKWIKIKKKVNTAPDPDASSPIDNTSKVMNKWSRKTKMLKIPKKRPDTILESYTPAKLLFESDNEINFDSDLADAIDKFSLQVSDDDINTIDEEIFAAPTVHVDEKVIEEEKTKKKRKSKVIKTKKKTIT